MRTQVSIYPQLYPIAKHWCRNLAGREYADRVIRTELNRASIPIVEMLPDGEVPSTIGGRLDGFTFQRGWRYWRVKGLMPYALAKYIHNRRGCEVRTAGFAGGVHPCNFSEWWTHDGIEIVSKADEADDKAFREEHPQITLPQMVFSDEPWTIGRRYVKSYHVDTIEGLRFLAKMIRRLRVK